MCGIIAITQVKQAPTVLREKATAMARKVRHRGPDWSGVYQDDHAVIAHERLSIVDVEHGAQPLIDKKTGRVLAVNGEIYTHKELRKRLKKSHDWQTSSDCEVLLYLYDEYGPEFLDWIDGIFAFVMYDPHTKKVFAARDHIGIVPLYMGTDAFGQVYFASELKALEGVCNNYRCFPPGSYYDGEGFTRWYDKDWMHEVPTKPVDKDVLRDALEESVKRQLMCDVPYGLLISGGLDSSVIAALAARHAKMRVETDEKEEAWWPRLHSFSIGLEGSPDVKHSQVIADHIGCVHHPITFTIQEGLDALSDVVYHLETYDVTTIRASTPMYLMARKIKSMGIKMVLSGEGADEIFGGYLYFHKAPDKVELHEETVRKIDQLSTYDCLRANKSLAAFGVECRVPFLGKDFLDVAMSFDPEAKMCTDRMEKHVLRSACEGLLPDSVLWRQKEQFSDGVGYSWIDTLKERAEELVSDEALAAAAQRFATNPPRSKEEYVYRTLFEEHFPSEAAARTVPSQKSIACSTPTALRWSKKFESMADPSGRAVDVHEQAVDSV